MPYSLGWDRGPTSPTKQPLCNLKRKGYSPNMASTENEYLLTTVDNPFNPFTEPEKWNQFDSEHGYHTTNYLARVLKTPFGLSEEDEKKK